MPAFATVLQSMRRAARLSQEELAERARLSVETISALERGARRAPYRSTVELLAEGLALSASARHLLASAATAAARRGARRQHLAGTETVSPQAPEARLEHLPQQRTSFVGREDVLAEIGALLRSHRLVTLVGPGGVGKTRTALQVAAQLGLAFTDDVWLIELGALMDGDAIPATLAHIMSIELSASSAVLDGLVRSLRSKCTLLIFDNCEHLVDSAAAIVSALLAGCAHLHVLATSRQALGIAGESAYQIPALPFPLATASLPAAGARAFAAIALFVERSEAHDFGFTLTDNNVAVVAEICRRLDGNPLAIELAAACTKFVSPEQLVERLDERFRLLIRGSRDALPRHQTLRALIDWSYELLDERECALLGRLSVFAASFTLEGAIAIGSGVMAEGAVFDVLASLVEKSLVLAESGDTERRFRLLETTRAYADEKLQASGERDLVYSRHLRYLKDRFEATRRGARRTAQRGEIHRLLADESEDVQAALERAVSAADLAVGRELLGVLGPAWERKPGIPARIWSGIRRGKKRS